MRLACRPHILGSINVLCICFDISDEVHAPGGRILLSNKNSNSNINTNTNTNTNKSTNTNTNTNTNTDTNTNNPQSVFKSINRLLLALQW